MAHVRLKRRPRLLRGVRKYPSGGGIGIEQLLKLRETYFSHTQIMWARGA